MPIKILDNRSQEVKNEQTEKKNTKDSLEDINISINSLADKQTFDLLSASNRNELFRKSLLVCLRGLKWIIKSHD